jgi:hypothetical protein
VSHSVTRADSSSYPSVRATLKWDESLSVAVPNSTLHYIYGRAANVTKTTTSVDEIIIDQVETAIHANATNAAVYSGSMLTSWGIEDRYAVRRAI